MGVGPPVGARGCGSAGRTLRGRTTVGVALTVFLMVEIEFIEVLISSNDLVKVM
jgi:hypothetical protein